MILHNCWLICVPIKGHRSRQTLFDRMYAENAFSHWEIKDGECWRCAPVPEVRRLLRTKFGRGSGH